MQKNVSYWTRRQILLSMKFIVLFVLIASMQAGAKVKSQEISYTAKNISLKTALDVIKKQSGYVFFFTYGALDKAQPVTLSVKNASLKEALDMCFQNQPLTYRFVDKTIVVERKKMLPAQAPPVTDFSPSPVVVQNTVHGRVTDSTGQPIAGASVMIKGTTKGTLTNKYGEYHIDVDKGEVLEFNFVGYNTKDVTVDGSNEINVQLTAKMSSLNDLVVVGYGIQTKATLTGAVEQIPEKVFQNRSVTNVGLMLQGQTPGLVVTRTSPRPGNEGLAFQIRGITSINGGSPLILVDGVPVVNYYSFQNMNPDDIANISILKDGAAAIYGSRAANGVILVTTKRGAGGKVRVDYNGNFRFTTPGITAFSPNMKQYATMWIDANAEETVPNWWGWISLDNMKKMQQGIEGIYPTAYWGNIFIGNADRTSEMFQRRYSFQHNLSISNSTGKSAYRLSFQYADNKGNLATALDGQKQYNATFAYDYHLSDKIKLSSNIMFVDAYTSTPSAGLDASLYGQEMPFFPAKNPFGEWYADYGTVGDRNPAAATSDGGRDNKNSLTSRIDLKGTYQIYKDLSFEAMASLQSERFNEERWVDPVQTYDWFGNKASTIISATQQTTSNPGYSTSAYTSYYQYYSGLFHYNKSINGIHNISATGGITAEKTNIQQFSAARVNFTDLGVHDISAADPTTQTNTGSKDVSGLYSYLLRLNYNYKEKYLAEFLGRRDGNSKFKQGNQFKNFFGGSLGWVFTKEAFLSDINNVLNFGKIRGSYSAMGNDAGLGNFLYLTTLKQGTGVFGYPGTLSPVTSLNNAGLVTLDNVWESVNQTNIGTDLYFLKSRLSATFDYFIKENDQMLSSIAFPSVLGGTAPKTNSGSLSTKGWEVTINWQETKKDYSYNISVNMSNTTNLLKNVQGDTTYGAGKYNVNGYPLNSWFVYKTDGYFKDQADVDAYYAKYGTSTDLAGFPQTNASVALRPGDTKKVAGPNGITSVGQKQSALVYKGDANPHYVFGINLGGSFKNFDVSAFFQGWLKQTIQRNGWMAYPFSSLTSNQNPTFLGKTWTEENPSAEFPRLTVNTNRARWNYANNDFMLQNNRYIRLKSLVVGYTLPEGLLKRIKVDKIRFYFSGNDLWELKNIRDGYDPEMGETSQNDGYPFYRTWSFGVNVGF